MSPDRRSHSRSLLKLMNFLADFDGEISSESAKLLHQLRRQTEQVPPLYCDVFGLPAAATTAELVHRIESLSPDQRAVASYAFQIFHSYEQMLRVQTATTPKQQAAYESQLEQMRLQVAKTKLVLHEAMQEQ